MWRPDRWPSGGRPSGGVTGRCPAVSLNLGPALLQHGELAALHDAPPGEGRRERCHGRGQAYLSSLDTAGGHDGTVRRSATPVGIGNTKAFAAATNRSEPSRMVASGSPHGRLDH